MTAIGLFLVVFGVLIILSRGPLIVAPERTRNVYLRLFQSDRRMRWFGLVMGGLAAIVAYLFVGVSGTIPLVVFYLALLIVVIMGFWLVPFPGSANRVATKIWSAFSPLVLRMIGAVSVLFGMWLVFLGFGL